MSTSAISTNLFPGLHFEPTVFDKEEFEEKIAEDLAEIVSKDTPNTDEEIRDAIQVYGASFWYSSPLQLNNLHTLVVHKLSIQLPEKNSGKGIIAATSKLLLKSSDYGKKWKAAFKTCLEQSVREVFDN